MGNVVFGDAEAAIVDVLRGSTDVAAFAPRVSTDLIGYAVPHRWVQVQRTGGIPTLWMRLDNPQIQIEVRAESKAVAFDLAEAARGAVFAARTVYTGRGLHLYDVIDTTGLTWSPDPDQPDAARYAFTLALVTRPTD